MLIYSEHKKCESIAILVHKNETNLKQCEMVTRKVYKLWY